jgi:phosphopantothenoylcysteine synthetase/decarboxylase
MPAALGDYAPKPQAGKIPSEKQHLTLELEPLPKVIEAVRAKAPKAFLVAFKAESSAKQLAARATSRMKRYKADAILANTTDAFAAATTKLYLHTPKGKPTTFAGTKATVLADAVAALAPKRKK